MFIGKSIGYSFGHTCKYRYLRERDRWDPPATSHGKFYVLVKVLIKTITSVQAEISLSEESAFTVFYFLEMEDAAMKAAITGNEKGLGSSNEKDATIQSKLDSVTVLEARSQGNLEHGQTNTASAESDGGPVSPVPMGDANECGLWSWLTVFGAYVYFLFTFYALS